MLHPKIVGIVWKLIYENERKYKKLRENLRKKIFINTFTSILMSIATANGAVLI